MRRVSGRKFAERLRILPMEWGIHSSGTLESKSQCQPIGEICVVIRTRVVLGATRRSKRPTCPGRTVSGSGLEKLLKVEVIQPSGVRRSTRELRAQTNGRPLVFVNTISSRNSDVIAAFGAPALFGRAVDRSVARCHPAFGHNLEQVQFILHPVQLLPDDDPVDGVANKRVELGS